MSLQDFSRYLWPFRFSLEKIELPNWKYSLYKYLFPVACLELFHVVRNSVSKNLDEDNSVGILTVSHHYETVLAPPNKKYFF